MSEQNSLENVLTGIVKAVANEPVKDYGFKSIRKRMEMASEEVVILADYSGSMNDIVHGKSALNHLKDALKAVFKDLPTARLIIFSGDACVVTLQQALEQQVISSTALHRGLLKARQFDPHKTIVITDGRPNDESLALDAANQLTGVIDVIYCGRDSDTYAIDFLNRLARSTGGRQMTVDLAVEKSIEKGFNQLLMLTDGNDNKSEDNGAICL